MSDFGFMGTQFFLPKKGIKRQRIESNKDFNNHKIEFSDNFTEKEKVPQMIRIFSIGITNQQRFLRIGGTQEGFQTNTSYIAPSANYRATSKYQFKISSYFVLDYLRFLIIIGLNTCFQFLGTGFKTYWHQIFYAIVAKK